MNKDFELVNRPHHDVLPSPAHSGEARGAITRVGRYIDATTHLADESFAAQLWRIIKNRKWTITAFTFVVVAIVMTVSFLAKPEYEAVGRVVVIFHRESDSGVLGFKGVSQTASEDPSDIAAIDTQMSILRTDRLAVRVINRLRLDENPSFAGNPALAGNQDWLVRKFHDDLSVSNPARTRLIEIRFRSRDPKLSADVVNRLTKEYVDEFYRNQLQLSSQISDFLADQLKQLKAQVGDSQQKLIQYQQTYGLSGVDEAKGIVSGKLDDLNRALTAAETERVQREVDYRLAKSGHPDLVAKLEPDGLVATLRAREADLEVQVARASVQLGPANPKMIELSKQLAQAKDAVNAETNRVAMRIDYAYRSAQDREAMLRRALEAQKRVADAMSARAVQAEILRHDFEANRQLYDDLLQKQKEISISSSLKSSNIWVVDPARVPRLPVSPSLPRNLALSVFGGIFGGILLALGLEKMKKTVETESQVMMLSSAPSLGVVPLAAAKHKHPAKLGIGGGNSEYSAALVCLQDPLSLSAESYKAVLTSLLLSQPSPPKVIQVTSAISGEGKTSISTNLAILLARLHRRVLLVDADLRHPSIHVAMHLKPTPGLRAVLRSASPFEEAVTSSPILPNLSVLPAGQSTLPEDTDSVFWNFKAHLERWRTLFDYIVIDTPPLLLVSDALRISVEADSVILVARSGHTAEDAFVRAQESLRRVNANLAGFVLNCVQLDSSYFQYHRNYYSHSNNKQIGGRV